MSSPRPVHFSPLSVKSRVAFIDDDQDYLDTLRSLVPSRYGATFHTSTKSLDPLLEQSAHSLDDERTALRAVLKFQQELDGWPAKAVHRYFANPTRHEIIGVLVADDVMPAENGIDFCSRHSHVGLRRALLTGIADQGKAIEAFNENCIELYLQKQASSFLTDLPRNIDSQLDASSSDRGALLLEALEPYLLDCLATRHAQLELNRLLEELRIVEYMLLGCPQGLLALSAGGTTYWIQLETMESKKALLETVVESGWGADCESRVRQDKTIINFDWTMQLGLSPSEVPARILSTAPFLCAGIFPLETLPEELRPRFPCGEQR